MAQYLAPLINDQQQDANGIPLSGGQIEVYLAGTSTPANTTSDKTGLVPNAWPILLNTLGVNEQGSVWIAGGSAYKYVIKDADGNVQRTIDNISGINDTTVSLDQWVAYQGAPTFITATSFSVVGDQTPTFQVNRRVKTVNTGGTVTSTIKTSVYAAGITTITVVNDSGVLDSGLSAVSYSLISAQNSSILPPGIFSGERIFAANGALVAADIGKSILVTATPITVTLPLVNLVPVGAAFHFASNNKFTIQAAGADTINNLNGTASTLAAAGNFTLVATSSGWLASTGYSKNVQATAGYSYLPNGVLMQWGSTVATSDGAGQVRFPYPIPFPNTVFTTIANIGDNGDNKTAVFGQLDVTNVVAAFVFVDSTTGSGRSAFVARINWVAFGN